MTMQYRDQDTQAPIRAGAQPHASAPQAAAYRACEGPPALRGHAALPAWIRLAMRARAPRPHSFETPAAPRVRPYWSIAPGAIVLLLGVALAYGTSVTLSERGHTTRWYGHIDAADTGTPLPVGRSGDRRFSDRRFKDHAMPTVTIAQLLRDDKAADSPAAARPNGAAETRSAPPTTEVPTSGSPRAMPVKAAHARRICADSHGCRRVPHPRRPPDVFDPGESRHFTGRQFADAPVPEPSAPRHEAAVSMLASHPASAEEIRSLYRSH